MAEVRTTRIQEIDAMLRDGKTYEQIVAALDLKSVNNFYRVLQNAGKRIEPVTRRLVDRNPKETAAA